MKASSDKPSGDVNTPVVALVGVVGALVVLVLIVGLMVWFDNLQETEIYKKDISQSPEEISNLIARQQAELHSYRWIDPKRKIASIPIDRAMERVVAELTTRPAGPVVATRPITTRATTGAAHHDK